MCGSGLPRLSSCCCGCSLKTGRLIIGGLQLACSLIFLLIALGVLAAGLTGVDLLPPDLQQRLVAQLDHVAIQQGDVDTIQLVTIVMGVLMVVTGIINTIIVSCFVHGARKVGAL